MERLSIDGAATIRRVALGVSSRMVFVVFMLGTALLTYSDDSVAEMDRLVSYLVYGAAVIGVAAAEHWHGVSDGVLSQSLNNGTA